MTAGDGTIDVAPGSTLTINNAITGPGQSSNTNAIGILIKANEGTLNLGGNNTINGLIINAGTVNANAAGALGVAYGNYGNTAGLLQVNSTTAGLNSQLNIVASQTVGSLSGATTITAGVSNYGVVAINLGAGQTLTINQTAALTYQGAFTGSGNLVVNGNKTLTLLPFLGTAPASSSSSFSGTTSIGGGATIALSTLGSVNGGVSALGNPSSAANGTIALAGGTLQYVGAGSSSDRTFSLSADSGTASVTSSSTTSPTVIWPAFRRAWSWAPPCSAKPWRPSTAPPSSWAAMPMRIFPQRPIAPLAMGS